jgi:hypothetical protein
MSKKRATEEILGSLHDAVATDLLRRVVSGEATPAELNAAIKFLANNGIEAIATEDSPLGKLVASLPTFDDDEDYVN